MRSLKKNKLSNNDMDFQKCGEILVAAKHDVYAMSCNYCKHRFTQIQAFMRHLQLQHADNLEFGKKEKNVEIYAVEELITTLSQSEERNEETENDSEESGVVEGDVNWLSEDQKWLDDWTEKLEEKEDNLQSKSLANMSILKALEDCDVSMNLVDNLDNTKYDGLDDNDEDNSDDEDDNILSNTLMQQIENDWNYGSDQENITKSKVEQNYECKDNEGDGKENEGDITITDDGITSNHNEENLKQNEVVKSVSSGLKGLLEGLEDLEDVDGLLENLEDSIIEDCQKIINNKTAEPAIKSNFVLETTVMDEADLTLMVNKDNSTGDNVMSFKLAKKTPNKKLEKSNNKPQKMVLNFESGELEYIDINSNESEDSDSMENENNKYNKFSDKSQKDKEEHHLRSEFELNDSIMADLDSQLNEEDMEGADNKLLNNFLNKNPKKETPKLNKNKKQDYFEEHLKNPKQEKPYKDILKNESNKLEQCAKSNSPNMIKVNKNNLKSKDKPKKTPEMEKIGNLKKMSSISKFSSEFINLCSEDDLDLHFSTSDESLDEDSLIFKKFMNRSLKTEKHQPCKEISLPNTLNDDLTKALEDALGDDDLKINNDNEENEFSLNQDLKNLLAQELMEEDIEQDNFKEKFTKSEVQQKQESKEKLKNLKHSIALKNNKNSSYNYFKPRYQKTNLKARKMQGHTIPLKSIKSIEMRELQDSDTRTLTSKNDKTLTLKTSETLTLQNLENNYCASENKNKIKSSETLTLQISQNEHSTPEIKNTFQDDQKFLKQNSQMPFKPKTPKKVQESQGSLLKPIETRNKLQELKSKTPKKLKENPEVFIQKLTPNKNIQEDLKQQLRSKTPKKQNANQENVLTTPSKETETKQTTPNKENQPNTAFQRNLRPKTPKTSKENQESWLKSRKKLATPNKDIDENLTPDLIKKLKKEKFTPHQLFINTERGDRTPLQSDALFFKQSPKTKEKIDGFPQDFTPTRGEITPKTRERLFLKLSPKTQEKNEDMSNDKTPTRVSNRSPKSKEQKTPTKPINKSPTTKYQNNLKQSPNTQEKNETLTNSKMEKTPRKIISPKLINKSPVKQMQHTSSFNTSNEKTLKKSISPTTTSKSPNKQRQIISSPPNSSKEFVFKSVLTTPQRIKNVAIRLPRMTPEKLQKNIINRNSPPENFKFPRSLLKPIPEKKSPSNLINTELTKTSPKIETKQNWNNFKLPSGITISKISPTKKLNHSINNEQSQLDETPIKPIYSKQNFSEASLEINPAQETKDLQTTLIKPQTQKKKSLLNTNFAIKRRVRKASIDIIPTISKINLKNNLSSRTTPKISSLDYKSYSVNRSARKNEIIRRMRPIKKDANRTTPKHSKNEVVQKMHLIRKEIFKSIENGENTTKNRLQFSANREEHTRVQINKVQILPTLKETVMTPLLNPYDKFKKTNINDTTKTSPPLKSPKNLNDDEKHAKISLFKTTSSSPINDDEKLIKKSLKRPASSPMETMVKQAKIPHKSPSNLESVVDLLQHDEELPTDDNSPNETSIESVEKEMQNIDKEKDNNNILDDLLQQVDNEQKSNDENKNYKKEVSEQRNKTIQLVTDFNETRDLNLLNKIGLKIIKSPDLEDIIPLDEIEEMVEKAKTFADIYRNSQKIWSSKNSDTPKIREELDISFKQLLTHTNSILNLELSMVDIKRAVNLISFWYVQNFNGKLVEKKKISDATNRYLQMFSYIPKTTKRGYYCEYCDEHFTTEHRYFTHRMLHTGATHPYECPNCLMGFNFMKFLTKHESTCHVKLTNGEKSVRLNLLRNQESKSYLNPTEKTNPSHFTCKVCSKMFETANKLYEHSKTHLTTMYTCAKCDLVFASAADVQNHMNFCNRNIKRIPKHSTPRPLKEKVESN